MDSTQALGAELRDALRAYDRARAVEVATRAVDDGSVTIDELYRQLSDVLVETGAGWQAGTTEVWQEHLLTGIVRSVVESCALRVERAAPEGRRHVALLAAPSDEYHDLGLRMLADRLVLAGWRAHSLGAAVPLGQLLAAVQALEADAVALSASTHFHRLQLRTYADRLTREVTSLRVWVGGPAFAHEHHGWDEDDVLDPLDVPRPGGR